MEIDARLPAIQPGRASDDGASDARPVAAPAAAAGSDFFISPVLRFDSRSLTVIFQVRDSRSGDVIRQFPPETVVARYRQDPSARPFVLPTPSVNDEPGREPETAAAAPAGPEGPEPSGAPPVPRGGPDAQAAPGEPVDLVA